MTPLRGFTPDAPTTVDGIIVDCSQWIPYEAGMKAAPSAVAQGAAALGAEVRGAATISKLDATRRVFAGTTAEIRELAGTTFTDRSRAGSPAYALGAGTFWSFVQFGDNTYACNIDTVVQKSTTAAFADVSGAPKARVLESVLTSGGGFVFAFNTIDGGFGTSPDRWWCSELNNGDGWTVNPSVTQCNSGRLLGANGPITAAKQLGADRIVAYKDRSLYVGTYVGPPAIWQFNEVPDVGCVGQNAIANLGTAHLFVGQDNIYVFDGARPIPIADGQVRQWFIDNSSVTYRSYTQVVFDRDAQLVWVFFPDAGAVSGTCTRALVYHLGTKQWGRADRTMEFAFIYNSATVTWDTLSFATWEDWTGTWDSLNPGVRVLAVFDSAHTLYTLTGVPAASYFIANDHGDDTIVSRIGDITLQYMTAPTTASISMYGSMATGGVPTTGLTQTAYDVPANGLNQFKVRQTARWHRPQFNFTGNCRVVAKNVPLIQTGRR